MEKVVTEQTLFTKLSTAILEMMITQSHKKKKKKILCQMMKSLSVNMELLATDKTHNTREISSTLNHHMWILQKRSTLVNQVCLLTNTARPILIKYCFVFFLSKKTPHIGRRLRVRRRQGIRSWGLFHRWHWRRRECGRRRGWRLCTWQEWVRSRFVEGRSMETFSRWRARSFGTFERSTWLFEKQKTPKVTIHSIRLVGSLRYNHDHICKM